MTMEATLKNWLKISLTTLFGLTAFFAVSTVAFAGTTPAISNTTHSTTGSSLKVLVEFNSPVWGDTAYSTGLAAADFQLGSGCSATITGIASVVHAAGDDWAILTMTGSIVADESACTIAAKANNIFTVGGALSEKTIAMDAAADTTGPTISSVKAKAGQTDLLITLNEPAFTNNSATGALVDADFTYTNTVAGNCTAFSAGADELHVAGNSWVVLQCDAAVAAGDLGGGIDSIVLTTGVFDTFGNASVIGTDVDLVDDSAVPTFATYFVATKGEAKIGGTNFLVKFSEPVFNAAAPALSDLLNADFAYSNASTGGATALAATVAQQTNDQEWVLLKVDTAFIAGDLDATADTIAAVATEIHDAFDNQQATTAIDLQDNTDPVILSIAYDKNAGGQNILVITYSEKVQITGLATASATLAASTATVADLAVAGALQGFGTFATAGTITVPTLLNTASIDSTQTIVTVTMAGVAAGYIATSSTTITVPSGVFSPEITGDGVKDIATVVNDIEITSTQSTLTTTTAWDTTRPTISSGVLSDAFYNDAAFVAGGTFNAGSDGKADQVVFTASEALKGSTLMPDASTTRDNWAITGAAGEFGSSLTVIKAAPVTAGDTGTTYTLNFSGAQTYYADPGTFSIVNTQGTTIPNFTDRAGNPVASGLTGETYKACFTGLTCSGSSIGNVAVITNSITQPATTADTKGPAAAKDLKATVVEGKEVVLTWTDPTDTDLSNIKIYRVKNAESETSPEVLAKGVKTYTDKAVIKGDKVKYRISGFDNGGNEGTKTEYTTEVTVEVPVVVEEKKEEVVKPISVELLKIGESGVPGTATLEEVGGKVKVTLALTTLEGDTVSHPAHIHMGTCAATGDIKHTLTPVVSSASVTTLTVSLAELKAQYPLYINVHSSDADLATSLACGNIEAETVLPEVELVGTVVEKAVAVVDGAITEAVSVQDVDSGAVVSIAAETTATVGGEAYTGTIAPPVPVEKEVTVPEGSKAASEVFKVDTGVTGSVVFDKPVTLVFPAKGTVSTKKVYTMYTVGADGKLSEPVICAVKTLDGAKVFECKSSHLTEFVILETEAVVEEEEEEKVAEAPFVDTKTHWSKDFVADLYAKKVVGGKDATHYAPDAYITRAEFTKIVIVGLGIDVKAAKDIKDMPFKDVKATDWALPYLDAAKTAGVIGGYKDGTFKSDAMINRAEAMKILFGAAKIETKNAPATKLTDVKQSEWYAKYVNYAVDKKIVSGYKDGTFGTDKNITRGEVAKIVSLLLAEL